MFNTYRSAGRSSDVKRGLPQSERTSWMGRHADIQPAVVSYILKSLCILKTNDMFSVVDNNHFVNPCTLMPMCVVNILIASLLLLTDVG